MSATFDPASLLLSENLNLNYQEFRGQIAKETHKELFSPHFLFVLLLEEVEMKTETEQPTEAKADDLEEEEKKPCVCCSKETDAKTDAAASKCSCRRESSASSEDSILSNKVGSVNVNPCRSCWR